MVKNVYDWLNKAAAVKQMEHTCVLLVLLIFCNVWFLTTASSICYATGDPHYLTFDEVWHDFQGDCAYTLVKECRDGIDTPFHVDVNNIAKELNIYGSYTYEVTVQIFETVSFKSNFSF